VLAEWLEEHHDSLCAALIDEIIEEDFGRPDQLTAQLL
jgi:hypothetical protein